MNRDNNRQSVFSDDIPENSGQGGTVKRQSQVINKRQSASIPSVTSSNRRDTKARSESVAHGAAAAARARAHSASTNNNDSSLDIAVDHVPSKYAQDKKNLGKFSPTHVFPLQNTANGVYSLRYNHDGKLLAFGLGSGGLMLLDCERREAHEELQAGRVNGAPVTALRFSPRNPDNLVATSTEGKIHMFDVKSGVEMATISEEHNEINALDFTSDGSRFMTAGKDLAVRVYDAATNKIEREFLGYDPIKGTGSIDDNALPRPSARTFCLKRHPASPFIFLTGGWDNSVRVWDLRLGDGVSRTIRGPHVSGDSLDLLDNNLLAGQWTAKNALSMYDFTSGEATKNYSCLPMDTRGAFIYTSAFVDKKRAIAGGSGQGKLFLFDIEKDELEGEFDLRGSVLCSHVFAPGTPQARVALGGVAPVIVQTAIDP